MRNGLILCITGLPSPLYRQVQQGMVPERTFVEFRGAPVLARGSVRTAAKSPGGAGGLLSIISTV